MDMYIIRIHLDVILFLELAFDASWGSSPLLRTQTSIDTAHFKELREPLKRSIVALSLCSEAEAFVQTHRCSLGSRRERASLVALFERNRVSKLSKIF